MEVPQYLGVSLRVEGAQIRRPYSSRARAFIVSRYGSLHKSRRVLQPHTRPSGKENQCEEEKRTWPTVSTRKVTMERSLTLQPLMEKRLPRPSPPSSSGLLPNPPARLHTSHTHTQRTHVRAEPTNTHTHALAHRTQRHVLSLNRLEPSLEKISLPPGIPYKGYYQQNTLLTHTVHVSHPVTRTHQYLSLLRRQNTETSRDKRHAASTD